MELKYAPLWDEEGQLQRNCTVREALSWLTQFGGHSPGELVSINGEDFKIGRLISFPDQYPIADRLISGIYDGYYHHLSLRV